MPKTERPCANTQRCSQGPKIRFVRPSHRRRNNEEMEVGQVRRSIGQVSLVDEMNTHCFVGTKPPGANIHLRQKTTSSEDLRSLIGLIVISQSNRFLSPWRANPSSSSSCENRFRLIAAQACCRELQSPLLTRCRRSAITSRANDIVVTREIHLFLPDFLVQQSE